MKRKAIPQWIREALEKREKQKQRELAKQQEEADVPAVTEPQETKDDEEVKEETKEQTEEKKPFFKIKKVRMYNLWHFSKSSLEVAGLFPSIPMRLK